MNRTRTTLVALVAGAGLALSACAPGGSDAGSDDAASPAPDAVKTDAASLGDVTLTVWDQEVRGGQEKQMSTLNAEFQKKYPNIKIKRVSRSFDDLVKTLRLALTGADAPDVVQANNTRSQMGEFVKAGQARQPRPLRHGIRLGQALPAVGPQRRVVLDRRQDLRLRVALWHAAGRRGRRHLLQRRQGSRRWGSTRPRRGPTSTRRSPRRSPRARSRSSWATSRSGPPATCSASSRAASPRPRTSARLGFGQTGGNWVTPENTKAAQTLVDWVDKGYFNAGFNGQDYDPAWQGFTKGQGLFLIAGSWLQADLSAAMKTDVKFMLPPAPEAGGTPVTTGGSGLPFAITQKAKNKDAAAAYVNFITSPEAMKVLADNGNLPVVETAEQKAPDALGTDVFTAFGTVSKDDGLVPYLDWATPTMGDTLGATLQDLLAKKATPEKALEALQKDYGDFTGK